MRLVLDTNIFISSVVADGVCRDLVRTRLRPHTIVTLEPLLDELRTTLRVKFKGDVDKLPLLSALRERAEIVVLATALAGKPQIIVSGDDDLR